MTTEINLDPIRAIADRVEIVGDAILIQADCAAVLPLLPKVDAVVTDPPYGIGAYSTGKMGAGVLAKQSTYEPTKWDNQPIPDNLVNQIVNSADWAVLFGGNYYALPPTSCWLVWDKENGANNFADCELAWTNLPKAVRLIKYRWHGMLRANGEQRHGHPTQKPIGVMRWCIGHLPNGDTILDPFMGSGTTGVAAIQLGRKFIGIEREARYFEIAVKRIFEASNQGNLFIDITPPEKPCQNNLFEKE